MKGSISILPVLLVMVCGRYLDRTDSDYADPNGVKVEYDPAVVSEEPIAPEEPEPVETLPESEPEFPDSCDDFPPPSCIKHFSALPPIIQRSPFALRTVHDFLQVCAAYKQALQCFGDYIARCKPEQPEARTFIDQMSGLLNQCQNPQIQQDALAALDCGKRMSSVHERCMRETRFIPQLKTLSSERLVQGETNSIRDLCWFDVLRDITRNKFTKTLFTVVCGIIKPVLWIKYKSDADRQRKKRRKDWKQ